MHASVATLRGRLNQFLSLKRTLANSKADSFGFSVCLKTGLGAVCLGLNYHRKWL